MTSLRWLTSLVGVCLLLAACASQDAPLAVDIEVDPAALGPSPVESLLGIGLSQSERDEQYRLEERERQERIALCMAEQGFEYAPIDVSGYSFYGDYTAESYRSKFGYGITTTFDETEDNRGILGHRQLTDPNSARVRAMTDNVRETYFDALRGADGGCEAKATVATTDTTVDAFYEEFGQAIDDLDASIFSDDRVVAALSNWSACMADAGYGFRNPSEIYGWLNEEMEPFHNGDLTIAPFDPDNVDEDERASIQSAQEILDELQERELKLYAVDQTCQENYQLAFRQVRYERETEFLDQFGTQISLFLGEQ